MFAKSTKTLCVFGSLSMRVAGGLGGWIWGRWDELRHAAAVIGTVLATVFARATGGAPVRKSFAWQVLSIGVEPLWFVGAVAMFVGISVVVQLSFLGRSSGTVATARAAAGGRRRPGTRPGIDQSHRDRPQRERDDD